MKTLNLKGPYAIAVILTILMLAFIPVVDSPQGVETHDPLVPIQPAARETSLVVPTRAGNATNQTNQTDHFGHGLDEDYPNYGTPIFVEENQTKLVVEKYVGNITITGNGKVRIISPVEINGIIKIYENGTLEIKGTEVTIRPPPIQVNDNVIHVKDTGKLFVKNKATLTVLPQPVRQLDPYDRTNASFIETDDDSRVEITDSTFNAHLPRDVVPEEERVTGGTLLVTGNSHWQVDGSNLNAFLNYTIVHDEDTNDTYAILERWFWMSSQMFGTVRIENSTCTLAEPGQTMFKPTNGIFILINSTVYGNVRPETIATFYVADSEISHVNDQPGYATIHEAMEFNDHTKGKVVRTKLYGDLKLGWSSVNDFLGKAGNSVELIDCDIYPSMISAYANTTFIMRNCRIHNETVHFDISDNVYLCLDRTDVGELGIETGIHHALVAIPENVTINLIDATLGRLACMDEGGIYNIKIEDGAEIKTFDTYSSDKFVDKIINVTLTNDSKVKFTNTKSGEINVILRNNGVPSGTYADTLTYYTRWIKDGQVTINGEPVAGAEVVLTVDGTPITTMTDEEGMYSILYDSDVEAGGTASKTVGPQVDLVISYLGFEKTEQLDTRSDHTTPADWEDVSPPDISGIAFTPEAFNQKTYITIESTIVDGGIGHIQTAILQYRTGDGAWTNVTMFNTEGDTFKAVLPRMDIGEQVEFRIVAIDALGNSQASSTEQFMIASEVIYVGVGFAALLLIIIVIAVFAAIVVSGKRSKYLKRRFTGEAKVSSKSFGTQPKGGA